jgi:hypothetical protein
MKSLKRPTHGTVAGYAGLLLGTIAVAGGPAMAASLVNGRNLKQGSVTAAKLAPGSVTAAKIRTGAVTRTKLAPSAVTASAIAAGAVDGSKVKDLSIGVADLSLVARALLKAAPATPDSVTTTTIVNNAVTADKLADFAVTTSKIADGAVASAKIANGAITAAKIADGAVGITAIADSAVGSSKIADGAVGGAKIPAGVVSAVAHVNAISSTTVQVDCAVGRHALGGGVKIDDSPFPTGVGALAAVVTISAPVFGLDNVPTGWTARVRDANGTVGTDFTVYAICA